MMAFSNRPTTTPKGAKNGNKKWPLSRRREGGRGKEQAIEAKSVPLTRRAEGRVEGKPVLWLSMLYNMGWMEGR